MFAGTVGPATRREYAVVGPTTNLAARLQARTKEEAGPVLIDDATAAAVMGEGRATAHTGVRTPSGPLVPVGPREIRASPAPSTAGPSPADAPRAGRVGSPAVADTLQHPRGTADVLPDEAERRDALTSRAAHLLGEAGYRRIETPIFEGTELFKRGRVGGSTDIVRKEMYTFEDGGGRSMTLRPEGTAGVARAYVQHGMHKLPQPVKLWYAGSFFRYERAQAGRQRQFAQIGAEVLGSDDPLVDAELITLLHRLIEGVGGQQIVLKLGSLARSRPAPTTASCSPTTSAPTRRSSPTTCAAASTRTRCARSMRRTPARRP